MDAKSIHGWCTYLHKSHGAHEDFVCGGPRERMTVSQHLTLKIQGLVSSISSIVPVPDLYALFSILHSPFSILYSPFSIFYSLFSILCSLLSMLRLLHPYTVSNIQGIGQDNLCSDVQTFLVQLQSRCGVTPYILCNIRHVK